MADWQTGHPIAWAALGYGPSDSSVAATFTDIDQLAKGSWKVLFSETGMTRDLDRGHEHFGYLDGVSQPGVRGEIEQFFQAHKFLTPSQNPDDPGQGLPGSDLIWPGAFVFGYQGQTGKGDDPGTPTNGGLPWMKNGTLMVFRRLKQLVPEFDAFVTQQAKKLDMDPDLLGARMVGRWKSGAPTVISPLQDEPVLAADELLNNDLSSRPMPGPPMPVCGAHPQNLSTRRYYPSICRAAERF